MQEGLKNSGPGREGAPRPADLSKGLPQASPIVSRSHRQDTPDVVKPFQNTYLLTPDSGGCGHGQVFTFPKAGLCPATPLPPPTFPLLEVTWSGGEGGLVSDGAERGWTFTLFSRIYAALPPETRGVAKSPFLCVSRSPSGAVSSCGDSGRTPKRLQESRRQLICFL